MSDQLHTRKWLGVNRSEPHTSVKHTEFLFDSVCVCPRMSSTGAMLRKWPIRMFSLVAHYTYNPNIVCILWWQPVEEDLTVERTGYAETEM